MLLLYAITRSTRRQNETSMSQFRERQDIAFHSSALHLHAAHQDTQVSLHPTPRADARQIWAHQQSGIQCVVTQPRSPIYATVSLSVPHGPHMVQSRSSLRTTTLTAQAQDSQRRPLFSGQLVKSRVPRRAAWSPPLWVS